MINPRTRRHQRSEPRQRPDRPPRPKRPTARNPAMISVDANLFRIAAFSVSTDETRFYLHGVYLEPHPVKGVILTATSGHTLTTIHDETGDMGGCNPVIVKLPSKVLAECKAKQTRKMTTEPRLSVDPSGDLATVHVNGEETARAYRVIVDGAFPDWRRTHPSTANDRAGADAAFSHHVMRVLVDTAAALGCPLVLSNTGDDAITLVNFPSCPHVSCLAMPFRADKIPTRPYWL